MVLGFARLAAFAVFVLGTSAFAQSERRQEADRWAARYLEYSGQPAATPEELRPISSRLLSVSDKCSSRPRNVAVMLWGVYVDYASRYDEPDETVPLSPRQFVVLLNVLVTDAYELNGNTRMGKGECIEALADALKADDYTLAEIAATYDGVYDPYTTP